MTSTDSPAKIARRASMSPAAAACPSPAARARAAASPRPAPGLHPTRPQRRGLAQQGQERPHRVVPVRQRGPHGDIPYNYVLISAPNGEGNTAYSTWHLQTIPRKTGTAGFELGTGIAVNPVPPEYAAARLRRALATQPPHGNLHHVIRSGN